MNKLSVHCVTWLTLLWLPCTKSKQNIHTKTEKHEQEGPVPHAPHCRRPHSRSRSLTFRPINLFLSLAIFYSVGEIKNKKKTEQSENSTRAQFKYIDTVEKSFRFRCGLLGCNLNMKKRNPTDQWSGRSEMMNTNKHLSVWQYLFVRCTSFSFVREAHHICIAACAYRQCSNKWQALHNFSRFFYVCFCAVSLDRCRRQTECAIG